MNMSSDAGREVPAYAGMTGGVWDMTGGGRDLGVAVGVGEWV